MDITAQVPELIQAINTSDLARIKELLELGADPNIEFDEVVPLRKTVSQVPYNKEMTSLLIEHGANVHAEDESRCSLLLHALLDSYFYTKKRTCEISKALEIIKLLLKYKATVNHIPYDSKHTVLDCAVSCVEDKKITLALLDAGASCSIYEKAHPFVAAAGKFDFPVIKRMVDCGAANTKDKNMLNEALIRAAARSRLKTIQFLLKQGADVHATSSGGQDTALHMATYDGNTAIMQILLQAGADCNKQNIYGDTPLMELLSNTELSQDMCITGSKLLIAYGADYKQLRNNKHQTAYEIARLRGIDLDTITMH